MFKKEKKTKMMDYYSNVKGPTREDAIDIIKNKLISHKKTQWLKNFVIYLVDEEISKYNGLGSQIGWSVTVEPSIWKKLLHKEDVYIRWKKFFYIMRVYNVFHKIYIINQMANI